MRFRSYNACAGGADSHSLTDAHLRVYGLKSVCWALGGCYSSAFTLLLFIAAAPSDTVYTSCSLERTAMTLPPPVSPCRMPILHDKP